MRVSHVNQLPRRRMGFFGLIVATFGLLGAWTAAEVSATNWGSTAPGGSPQNAVSLADDRYHYVYTGFLSGNIRTETEYARDSIYGLSTDLNTFQGGPWFDVSVYYADHGMNGAFGWVNCPGSATTTGSHPNRTCYGQTLVLNAYAGYAYGFDTWSERVFQACHELGHTVGLRHDTGTTCMVTGNGNTTVLSAEDISHINAQY